MIPDETIDRLLAHVRPHIQRHLDLQASQARQRKPFILALTGLQGSGKTTWTSAIVRLLNEKYHVRTINVSLDDFYLPHEGLVRLRQENPANELWKMRGQPGTHDPVLLREFFNSLTVTSETSPSEVCIPAFDKSQFNGEGDRVPRDQWRRVPVSMDSPVEVLVLEGWCVGFQPLSEEAIEAKWKEAKEHHHHPPSPAHAESAFSTHTLQNHALSSYYTINQSLRNYCDMFMGPQHLDFLVHLDTDDLANVYRWRMQQEHALHQAKHQGMTDEEVVAFVQGYMPAYELYLDSVRSGIFRGLSDGQRTHKGQARVVLGRDRQVLDMVGYN
ncbi:TDA10 family protein [Aspergillus saccharolyticus JOP 1030-1]|uniref:P-loop containing nucleoside triphosphate hydrolase protein n=1 Tax=Aspergillus saccharolyticus JOP 1030-1 TaxID=1450539 RepID=A0A318ZPC3_9EURO|nr:P-loop containing nucleoside triphosphate hydrolase protein [Aspergillus saccharolyticus JOP 1030-1]PYH49439.1 P-loop containing nucleoside triphosphate hydrolase protein [Aspergillus saccharolyticus JOP 1030-1]